MKINNLTVAAIVTLAFGITAGSLYVNLQKTKRELKSKDSALTSANAEITWHKNAQGKLIAEKQAAEIRAKDLEQSFPKLAEVLTEQMDIKIKNLKAAIHAEFMAQGDGVVDIHYHYDSATGKPIPSRWQFNVDDGYLDLKAEGLDSLQATYAYTYGDTLTYAFELRKKWLLGNKSLYGSGMLRNPGARIVNSESVLIDDFKDKRFGIGPYVGYGFGPDGGQTTIGISVHWSVFKF